MSWQVFSLQHKHILFDQELLADRIAVLCPQTISKTQRWLSRNPVCCEFEINSRMNAEHYWPSVTQYASGAARCMSRSLRGAVIIKHYWCQCYSGINPSLYHLKMDQWQVMLMSNWPIRSLIIVLLPGYCYCVVSPGLCSINLMSPLLLSNVWPRKNKTQKYTAAAENSMFLAKFGLDRESEKLQEIVWHQM